MRVSTDKPHIYFDDLKDQFYPNGCYMCCFKSDIGHGEDMGVGITALDAYNDFMQILDNQQTKARV